MVKPWARAGFRCICYDTQHRIRNPKIWDYPGGGSIEYRWGDVRSIVPRKNVEIMFAFPPCTHLAISGARDWKSKGLRLFIDALEVVEACRMLCEYSRAPWMLEQPVSRLSTAWRKPDYTFHPWEYGDGYNKRTCLWIGNGFIIPPKEPGPITKPDFIHRMGVKEGRANRRSETPMGFAKAVFKANYQHV